MSYWSDEAVQKRAAEAEEMRLQWKFRSVTTSQLEMRLENAAMSQQSQKDIELELVRRGATYIKRSYYERPSKFFGSDGSELIIAAAGEGVGHTVYDWANIIAAESAYMDEVLAKPIPKVSSADMGKFLDSQKAMIRRVVPGLISAESISGVQPMTKHIDVLPFFKAMKTKPFEDYALTKEAIDGIIAADKDLQPLKSPFWSDRIDRQSIGRGLRPTVHFGDLHISDYMGLMHTTETPKSSTAIAKLMESIKQSEATHASFFDTESTFTSNAISGDYFGKIDTSKWISEYKESMDKFVEDAMTLRRPYFSDITDDSVSRMYPNTLSAIELSLGNKCMEIPITPIMKGTEITSISSCFDDIWKIQLEAMKKSTRALYYSNPFAVVTAKAPEYKASRVMAAASEGIYPERKMHEGIIHCPYIPESLSSKELCGGWKMDDMISISIPTSQDKSELTVDIAKKRDFGGPAKYIKFDLTTKGFFDCESTVKKTKEEDTAETLALLGIGVEQ